MIDHYYIILFYSGEQDVAPYTVQLKAFTVCRIWHVHLDLDGRKCLVRSKVATLRAIADFVKSTDLRDIKDQVDSHIQRIKEAHLIPKKTRKK